MEKSYLPTLCALKTLWSEYVIRCLGYDPEKPQGHNVTVCLAIWFNEGNEDAL